MTMKRPHFITHINFINYFQIVLIYFFFYLKIAFYKSHYEQTLRTETGVNVCKCITETFGTQ